MYEYPHIDFSFINILCLKMNNTGETKEKITSTATSYRLSNVCGSKVMAKKLLIID